MSASAASAARPVGRVAPAVTVCRAAIALGAVLVAAGAVLLVLNLGTPLPEGTDWRATTFGSVVFFACGAVLALRLPGSPLSWVVLAIGVSNAAAFAAVEYAVHALLTSPGALPGGGLAQWLAMWVWLPGYGMLVTLLLLLFPDGRPGPSPRWRALVPASIAVIAAATGSIAFAEWSSLGEPVFDPAVGNPVAVPALADVLGAVAYGLIPLALCCAASVVVRLRRSTGVERRQLRWFGAGVGVALALLAAGQADLGVAPVALALAFAVLPAAVAVAVLRHGLWELGPLARRSVVAAVLSVGVLAVYGLATVLLGGGEVAATAVVAVLLLPLRTRLERFVNRLLYGVRDEPWTAVRRLGERLSAPASPGDVAAEIGRALRLPEVALVAADTAHDAPPGALALPLIFRGARVGTLVAGGRELAAADRRALEDLAPQVAAALHAGRLAEDLQRSRELIVTAREEERRRLRADLHDEVGPSLAVLALRLDAAAAATSDPAPLRELATQARDTLSQVRRIASDLRPAALADLGLEAALDGAVRQIDGAGLAARLDVPAQLGDLPAACEVAAYRIVREALSNVVRHARATSCSVRVVRHDGGLVVTVADDGVGIAADALRGVGLESMAERAAELGGTLEVAAGAPGTRIVARLPA